MISFSIFLPVRNGLPYIKECVESILCQTYPKFELCILDNNSQDGTIDWLDSLSDPRIKILKSASSLSITESWKRVLDIPKKEFMTMIGHDDILDPAFLESIKNLIDQYPDAGLYATSGRLINSDGKIIRSCKPVDQFETASKYLKTRFQLSRDVGGTGYVMRSSSYDQFGGIPAFEKLFFADDALWISLMHGKYLVTDNNEHFSVRIHSKSESASLPSAWNSILIALQQFNQFLKDFKNTDIEASRVINMHLENFMLNYHRNALIFALVEASQKGRSISKETKEAIMSSLSSCAPRVAHKLFSHLTVKLISSLNAYKTRILIPFLWNFYSKVKNRS